MPEEISFDNNNNNFNYKSRVILGQPETPKMVKFLIGKGIVKSEKQAGYLMICMTMLFFLSSFILIYLNFFKQPYIPEMSPEDQILMQQGTIIVQ